MDCLLWCMETSKDFYQQILGLGKDWKVTSVDTDLSAKTVKICLGHNSKTGYCNECEKQSPIYDHTTARQWRHLDTMQLSTILEAKIPRVKCSQCGVKNAFLPWTEKHSRFTLMFEAFAVEVLQISKSVTDAKNFLGLTWEQAHNIMDRAVARGLSRRDEEEITWLGMDEKSFRSGHSYISVLNDLEQGRVIDVEGGRSSEVAENLLKKGLSDYQREMVCGVSIDMSAPYIKAIKKLLPHADIVHDKFHISQHLSHGVDLTRRQENRALVKQGDKSLVGTKYDWLRSQAGLKDSEIASLDYAFARGLEVAKAWHHKELFHLFWQKKDADSALKFFAYWAYEVLKSGNKHMIKVMKTLWRHMDNILTYFDCFISNAVSEGLNSKIQAIKANARGFRSFKNYRIAILFFCGKLNLAPRNS